MRYWNKSKTKSKNVRESSWYCVKLPQGEPVSIGLKTYFFPGFESYLEFDTLKHTLQMTDGYGKFYMNVMKKEVWFERKEDAMMFELTRSN